MNGQGNIVGVQQLIVIVGVIMCVFSSLYRLSVEICACLVVCSDCRWNCMRFLVVYSECRYNCVQFLVIYCDYRLNYVRD